MTVDACVSENQVAKLSCQATLKTFPYNAYQYSCSQGDNVKFLFFPFDECGGDAEIKPIPKNTCISGLKVNCY